MEEQIWHWASHVQSFKGERQKHMFSKSRGDNVCAFRTRVAGGHAKRIAGGLSFFSGSGALQLAPNTERRGRE